LRSTWERTVVNRRRLACTLGVIVVAVPVLIIL